MTEHVRIPSDADFGAFLLDANLLDAPSVERARRAAEATGDRFDQVLTKLGLMSDANLATGLARYLNLPLVAPGSLPSEPILADRLPPAFVRENRILPVRLGAEGLTLAVVDPFDRVPLASVRFVVDEAIHYEIITPAEFERAVESLYGGDASSGADPAPAADDASEFDLQRLRDSASEAPVIRLVNQIIAEAVDARTSDIYIEPSAASLIVRFRVDGLLRVAQEVPSHLRAAVISRIKIMAHLDIAERRLPQDGRIKLAFRGHDIDFRVATIPTMDGETVTLRVLDRSRVKLDFPELGFDPDQIESFERLMAQPNGIILVTGPTGSGKTTTLYTMLKHVNRPTVKIFTVEDPIEYQLAGISQVQVQPNIDLDFPACLRAILRHHPNMIMIGEIRDTDTARIAVQSSLTGHLVFSTLHTNSAAESVTRLLDMGIEHFMLGSTLRGIMAQRLVRRLCPHCASPHEAAGAAAEHFAQRIPWLKEQGAPRLLRPVGCEKCQGSGFQGQLSIAELVMIDGDIQAAILQRVPAVEIGRIAHAKGARTLYEDGVCKAWRGLTTVEEVLRVTNSV
jgi:general secretion pathway protein E